MVDPLVCVAHWVSRFYYVRRVPIKDAEISDFIPTIGYHGHCQCSHHSNVPTVAGNSLRVFPLSGILVQSVRGVQLFVPYLGNSFSLIPSIVHIVGIASPLQDYTDRVYESSVLQRTMSVDEGATSCHCNPFRILQVIAEITRLPSAPHPRSLSFSAGLTRIYPTRVNPTYCCLLVEVIRDFHKAGDWPLQSSILPTGFSIDADRRTLARSLFPVR